MAENEINKAFEILLEELDPLVGDLNQAGAKALGSGEYDKASGLMDRAMRLTGLRERAKELEREWHTVVAAAPPRPRKRRRTMKGQLTRGLRTREPAFRMPILEALVELGGSGQINKVLHLVGAKMRGRLNDHDRQRLPSDPNTIRWRNTAQWSRLVLVKEGLLRADSPRGIWEITPEGRTALQKRSEAEPRG